MKKTFQIKKTFSMGLAACMMLSAFVMNVSAADSTSKSMQNIRLSYQNVIDEVNELYGLNYWLPSDQELAASGLSNPTLEELSSKVTIEEFRASLIEIAEAAAETEAIANEQAMLSHENASSPLGEFEVAAPRANPGDDYKILTRKVVGAEATLSAWASFGSYWHWTTIPTITTRKLDEAEHRFVGNDEKHKATLVDSGRTYAVTLVGTMYDLSAGIFWIPRDATQYVDFWAGSKSN